MKPPRIARLVLLGATVALVPACRGGISTEPPVHLVLDMDFQPKLKAQSESKFPGWTDHRGMRVPAAKTIAQGSLVDPVLLPVPAFPGKLRDGTYMPDNPVPISMAVLERGRERYDINCAVCHGYSGRGGNKEAAHGIVGRRWPVPIPSFHESIKAGADNRVANLKAGEIFEVISMGKGTMPAYGGHLGVTDRWAVIHYIRALQRLGKQP